MFQFGKDFSQERQIVGVIAIAQSIALLISGGVFLFAWDSFRWITLAVGVISLLSLAFLGLFLYLRYRSLPVVKKKRALEVRECELQKEIDNTKAHVNQAIRTREYITKDEQKEIARRLAVHNQTLENLASRRKEIKMTARQEYVAILKRLQDKHFAEGLRKRLIKNAKISGVGPKMKEHLALNGIVSASQITVAGVSSVPGFGESKTLAVVNWRRSVERELEATKPNRLSSDKESIIRRKHDQRMEGTQVEEENTRRELEAYLAAIRQEAIKRHSANDEAEVKAREKVEKLEPKKEELATRLAPLAQITPRNFLKQCLPAYDGQPTHRQVLAIGGISLVFISGFFCQTTAALSSLGSIIVDLIPTGTPTATLTPTTTNTPASSSTPTSTITLTPTITFTPTITQTPTITPTSTITLTPTITMTPTVTIPAINSAQCIPQGTKREVGTVTGVIDGDTIYVRIEGVTYKVRYIGMDTPEEGQQYAYQATMKNNELVQGKTITLVKDVSETDQYNRLLRYVLVEKIFVNYELVRQGYASIMTYPPDVTCQDTFHAAQTLARESELGIWAPTPTPYPTSTPGPSGNCDPSYPTVCIPPYPPDLDCDEIPYRRFKVLPPDPHGFDGDDDGIGCESG